MNKKRVLLMTVALLAVVALAGCSSPTPTPKPAAPVGSIKINPHPSSLEGKTIVLRWNSKPNGDKYLTTLSRLLAQKVPSAKIINLWEQDKSTAVISDSDATSQQITDKIAALKPDLVIASQAD